VHVAITTVTYAPPSSRSIFLVFPT